MHLHGPGAGLFWWETLTNGRAASGEHFHYESVTMRSAIYVNQRPIAMERFQLEPALIHVSSPARLGPFACCSTFFICKSAVDAITWKELTLQLEDLAEKKSVKTVWGISPLVSDGLVVRGLAMHYADLYPGLVEFWDIAKRRLYGRPAIPPRKIY
jgi:urease accessory protein UreH